MTSSRNMVSMGLTTSIVFYGIQLLVHTLFQRFNYFAAEVKAWVGKYIPLFYMNIITYPWTNPDAGLDNACG